MSSCDLAAVWLRAVGGVISHERMRQHVAVRLRAASKCAGAPCPGPCDHEHEPCEVTVVVLCYASQGDVQLDGDVALAPLGEGFIL